MKTRQFKVDKLIRDNIPDVLRLRGISVDERVMETDEYIQRLKEKLVEEGREVLTANSLSEIEEELADVMEVFHSLVSVLGVSFEEVEKKRIAKGEVSGRFERRIYCAKIEVAISNPAIDYCASRPEEYPEIKN